MLTKIEARSASGDVLTLPFAQNSLGVTLAEVGGLDPVKASLVSTKFAELDGEKFRTGRRDARNITLSIELEADYLDYSIAEVRRRLYRFFMTNTKVSLRIFDDTGVSYDIAGYVEDCQVAMFAQEPTTDVSIVCYSPDFIESTGLSWGSITAQNYVELARTYDGTVPAPIEFTLSPNRALSSFSIYNRTPEGMLTQLDFAAPLQAGDKVLISTVPGSKKAVLTRAGIDTSVLYGVSPRSTWIRLWPGINKYRIYAEGAGVPFTISYSNRYGGL